MEGLSPKPKNAVPLICHARHCSAWSKGYKRIRICMCKCLKEHTYIHVLCVPIRPYE